MDLSLITKSANKILALNELGIYNVVDLITHYPFRYNINEVIPFDNWQVGAKICFEAQLISPIKKIFYGSHQCISRFNVLYEDNELNISLFNRAYLKQLDNTDNITIFGKYEGNGKVVATNVNFKPLIEQLGIVGVYNIKDGISQKELNKYISKGLALKSGKIVDVIPMNLREQYRLISKEMALFQIHQPQNQEMLKQALRHLKYEEFLKFHITMLSIKKEVSVQKKVPKNFDMTKIKALIDTLSFTLTLEQQKALDEILQDLNSEHIMYRLLQGDVGSGKTVVSAVAMYANVLAGYQAVLMAPTEILAKQHVTSFMKMFPKLKIVLLCASLKRQLKEMALMQIETGEAQIIIGTHSLFQEKVNYHKVGIVVADEQHRFGVEQRKALKDKGDQVDFLLMSATPIPRTLAISMFGDMDVSTIDKLPEGRKAIETMLIKENSIKPILNNVVAFLQTGMQVYVICPLIEESENLDLKNANAIYKILGQVLKDYGLVGLMHGKMSADEKSATMQAFVANEIQVLVSTTVIEVGVNVPNANMMIIYDASRFGLSQLHQLRGRIGRGNESAYCYLLSDSKDQDAIKRLEVIRDNHDGFEIARQDLLIRGCGDVLGKRQSGISGLILGDIAIDSKILEVSRNDAVEIIEHFDDENYAALRLWLSKQDKITYVD